MAFTSNYNLKKPELDESYDISHQNGNWDIIDTQLGLLNSGVSSKLNLSGGVVTGTLYVGSESKIKLEASTGNIYSNGKIMATQEWVKNNGTVPNVLTLKDGCTIDGTGGHLRLRSASGMQSLDAENDRNIVFYFHGAAKHVFREDGTKMGGSIEINGKNLGMSPIDSPRVQIQDTIKDVQVDPDGTIVYLDDNFSKAIDGYSVFPSNGQVEVSSKDKNSFLVKGNGKVDLLVIGNRIGYKNTYWQEMPMKKEGKSNG